MNKKYFLVIYVSNLINAVNSPTFEELITAHDQAFQKFEPHASSVIYAKKIDPGLLTTLQLEQWKFGTPEARSTFLNYQKANYELAAHLIKKSAKNGLLFGTLLALGNCALNGAEINPKAYAAYFAIPVLASLFQSSNALKTPYFDRSIKKRDNLFGRFENLAITRGMLFVLTSTISALGVTILADLSCGPLESIVKKFKNEIALL